MVKIYTYTENMERIRTKANAYRVLFLEDGRATVMNVADFLLNEQLRININTYNKQNNKPNKQITPEPLYNTVHYNMILDITRTRVGPKMAILNSISYITYAFNTQYNTVWIAYTEIGLDPNNSVIKRLWCNIKSKKRRKFRWYY